MNDFWNDPPEVDEIPECCDEVMTVDIQGNCLCSICGKTIARPPDIEPVFEQAEELPFEWKMTHIPGLNFWTAEPQPYVVYRIFQKNETVFQCYRTTGANYQFCCPITNDLDSFEAAEAACKHNYYELKTPPSEPHGYEFACGCVVTDGCRSYCSKHGEALSYGGPDYPEGDDSDIVRRF